ncbi:hypothetical protein [Cohnella sp. GCM10012308]
MLEGESPSIGKALGQLGALSGGSWYSLDHLMHEVIQSIWAGLRR